MLSNKKHSVIGLLLLISSSISWSQGNNISYLSIDYGMGFYSCNVPDYDFVRRSVSSSQYYSSANGYSSFYYKWYAGVKMEHFIKNRKLGIITGLRYLQVNNSLGKVNSYTGSSKAMYIRTSESGLDTEYLKVNEINQQTNYIGVPLEIKVYPFSARKFKVYFKGATGLFYKLSTKEDVVFSNPEMDIHEEEVLALFGKTNSIFSYFSVHGGIKIGRQNKPNLTVEVMFPSFILTKNSSSLMSPDYGGGFQVNYHIPLKLNQ